MWREARSKKREARRLKAHCGVALALEGAGCLRRVEDMDWFHEAGVRMVSLAWAEGTKWAGGDQAGGRAGISRRRGGNW